METPNSSWNLIYWLALGYALLFIVWVNVWAFWTNLRTGDEESDVRIDAENARIDEFWREKSKESNDEDWGRAFYDPSHPSYIGPPDSDSDWDGHR